ncbi:hypothetical protein [Nocardia sp. NBC_01388]|uniref:hypothetical protein n=1 Tax=Nocardia sp. NBC_01388 TaxID=2903596 RepID=UPI003255645D
MALDDLQGPDIEEAGGTGVLPLSKVTAGATVRLPVWPAARVGQAVWISCQFAGSDASSLRVRSGAPLTKGELQNGYALGFIGPEYFEGCSPGARLQIRPSVSVDGKGMERTALAFPALEWLIQ